MNLSVVIITKNEEKMIVDCIKSVSFADEVLVVDSESTDKTVEIAKKLGAKVFIHKFKNFAEQRSYGLSKAKGDWVLYLDADERVTKELKEEIEKILRYYPPSPRLRRAGEIAILRNSFNAFRIPRKNFYFGNCEWPMIEKLERLFLRKTLIGWQGTVHESPIVEGKVDELKNYLFHYTHRDLESMIEKTNQWSELEAEILYKSSHPKMTWWRFLRIMASKFLESYIGQQGWKMGTVGLIESIYQAYSYFIIYAKLWEKQQEKLKAQNSNVKTTT